MEFDINYLGVLAAAVAGFAVGAFWFSQIGFGKWWMREMGYTPERMKAMKMTPAQSTALGFVAFLVMSYVLAHVVDLGRIAAHSIDVLDGVMIGFWMWLGFVMPINAGIVLWENKSVKLFLLTTTYYLVALLLMGAVLAWL